MYTKKNYGFWMTFNWSKWPFFWGLIYASIIAGLSIVVRYYFDVDISISWQPISVLGIAVAFYLGFKNNASYDRTWEARKIWGGIVNTSRTFGVAVCAFIQGEGSDAIKKELIYRHIAWLTALRYQLRLAREWEHTEDRVKGLYIPEVSEAYLDQLDNDLGPFISHEEYQEYKTRANMATQILKKQSLRLQELKDQNYFDDFRHMEFHHHIASLYEEQGRSERIKNFPFPRQYASTALWMTVVFSLLLPFGMTEIFKEKGEIMFWLCVPMSALINWAFFLMEKIGDYSENPFEGTYNDVPITSISRGIENDLREMINDDNISKPLASTNGFLM